MGSFSVQIASNGFIVQSIANYGYITSGSAPQVEIFKTKEEALDRIKQYLGFDVTF